MSVLVPTYGNWGGPGYSGGRRPKSIRRNRWTLAPPIDDVDEAFMLHDFGYENKDYLAADRALIKRLGDPKLGSYPWLAKKVFEVMSFAREMGVLDPGSSNDPKLVNRAISAAKTLGLTDPAVESNPGPRSKLAQRLAHLKPEPFGHDHHIPAFPTYSRSSLALLDQTSGMAYTASAILYPATGFPTHFSSSSYLDKPIPFTLVGNDIAPSLQASALLDVEYTWDAQITPASTGLFNIRIGVTVFESDGVTIWEDHDLFYPVNFTAAVLTKLSFSFRRRITWKPTQRLRYYLICPVDLSFAGGGQCTFSVLNEGSPIGVQSRYWLPFTDSQLGLPTEGFKPRGIVKPWEPSPEVDSGKTDGTIDCTPVGPVKAVTHTPGLWTDDDDESSPDNSDSDYSDTSDEVTTLLNEFRERRRAKRYARLEKL